MTNLKILAPTEGTICPANQPGEMVLEITKPAWLIFYSIPIEILNPNSVVCWSGEATIFDGKAMVALNWPSEPGEYVIYAKLLDGINEQRASVRGRFIVR